MFTPDSCPQIVIEEQPKQKALRFRYATEGEKAGNLQGENSTPEHTTFPSIRLLNCDERYVSADIFASCVSATTPFYPHPHRLVGPDCSSGVCSVSIRQNLQQNPVIQFPKIGVQCCKQKAADIATSLKQRCDVARDPFYTGFPPNGLYDLTTIRLCFQCQLKTAANNTINLQPVVSNAVIDKRVVGDLTISHLSRTSGSVRGRDEVFLLCNTVKKDTEVIFETDDKLWNAKGDFAPSDIHKQVAIVFMTPAFCEQSITAPVDVNIYLHSPSQGERSQPRRFKYCPENPDPYGIESKRKRKVNSFVKFLTDTNALSQLANSPSGLFGHYTSAPVVQTFNQPSLPSGVLGLPPPRMSTQNATVSRPPAVHHRFPTVSGLSEGVYIKQEEQPAVPALPSTSRLPSQVPSLPSSMYRLPLCNPPNVPSPNFTPSAGVMPPFRPNQSTTTRPSTSSLVQTHQPRHVVPSADSRPPFHAAPVRMTSFQMANVAGYGQPSMPLSTQLPAANLGQPTAINQVLRLSAHSRETLPSGLLFDTRPRSLSTVDLRNYSTNQHPPSQMVPDTKPVISMDGEVGFDEHDLLNFLEDLDRSTLSDFVSSVTNHDLPQHNVAAAAATQLPTAAAQRPTAVAASLALAAATAPVAAPVTAAAAVPVTAAVPVAAQAPVARNNLFAGIDHNDQEFWQLYNELDQLNSLSRN